MSWFLIVLLGGGLGAWLGKVYPYQRLRAWVRGKRDAYRRWKFKRKHRVIK